VWYRTSEIFPSFENQILTSKPLQLSKLVIFAFFDNKYLSLLNESTNRKRRISGKTSFFQRKGLDKGSYWIEAIW
jgi:hypothetical protein